VEKERGSLEYREGEYVVGKRLECREGGLNLEKEIRKRRRAGDQNVEKERGSLEYREGEYAVGKRLECREGD